MGEASPAQVQASHRAPTPCKTPYRTQGEAVVVLGTDVPPTEDGLEACDTLTFLRAGEDHHALLALKLHEVAERDGACRTIRQDHVESRGALLGVETRDRDVEVDVVPAVDEERL